MGEDTYQFWRIKSVGMERFKEKNFVDSDRNQKNIFTMKKYDEKKKKLYKLGFLN